VLRQVVVFRLRPLSGPPPVDLPRVPITPDRASARTEVVPVEERHTERAFVAPDREPYELERREADLVHRYRSYLLRRGHTVSRLRVVPAGESAPLYSDLWDETARDLVEAKGGSDPGASPNSCRTAARLRPVRRREDPHAARTDASAEGSPRSSRDCRHRRRVPGRRTMAPHLVGRSRRRPCIARSRRPNAASIRARWGAAGGSPS
jgi:hypothetical protein